MIMNIMDICMILRKIMKYILMDRHVYCHLKVNILFGDLNIVEQYNMTCSVKDQNHFVDASLLMYLYFISRESSCQCGNHSMLEQLASMKGVSHRYYMNWMGTLSIEYFI